MPLGNVIIIACYNYINNSKDKKSIECILDDLMKSFGINKEDLESEIKTQIEDISNVKKIDFYLWALFAK